MTQPDDQNNLGLRVSGYRPRIIQTVIAVIVMVAIVSTIALVAIWSNRQDPEVGAQPTPRPTQSHEPTATLLPSNTPTSKPTALKEDRVPDTATPSPKTMLVQDTPTSEPQEMPKPTTELVTVTPLPTATKMPATEMAPTPEPTPTASPQPTNTPISPEFTPTVESTLTPPQPTDTPIPPTDTPTAEHTAKATHTSVPEPTTKPTITPTSVPTATPITTPTPKPSVPTTLEIKARGQLIDRGINQSGIKVLSSEEHTWLDLTLGCGAIKGDNPARPVDGWILILGNDEKTYRFHVAGKDQEILADLKLRDDIIRDCTDVENPEQFTVNLVHDLRLHEARRIVLYRGPASGEQKPVQDIQDGALIQAIIDALNTRTPIGNSVTCETSYRLDFYVLRGVQTIRFFCSNDWYRGEGDQEVWRGTQGALTQDLLDEVAQYLAAEPLPGLPELTPEK